MKQKPIPYNPNYLIDEEGKLFNTKTNKYLTGFLDKDGYRIYHVNPNQKAFMAHRLVAEAFLPNPNNLPFVNHIDENKSNCELSNLEWVSRSQNTAKSSKVQNPVKKELKYYKENLSGEIWKPLFRIYEISNKGRIKNKTTGQLKSYHISNGYFRTTLIDDRNFIGDKHNYKVHMLVYNTFHNCAYNERTHVIDHIDHNKQNNCLENLRLITRSENNLHYQEFKKSSI